MLKSRTNTYSFLSLFVCVSVSDRHRHRRAVFTDTPAALGPPSFLFDVYPKCDTKCV